MNETAGPPWPVLLTIPNFVTAGSGRALVNVAERLDRRQFQPIVAVAKKAGAPLERRLEEVGIEVIELDLRLPPRPYASLPLRARKAARGLRARSISIVHSFDYGDTYTEAMATRLAGACYISTKKNMGWGSRAWYLRSLASHRIAVQNEEMFRSFFSGRLLRDRCRYVPRGVVVDHFAASGDLQEVRRSFGIPDGAVVIGCVASICGGKNQELLLRALPADERVLLLLAGPVIDEAYAQDLHATAKDLGVIDRVVFTGELEDVRPVLWASDVFALASHAEGSPVALIEAMSAALPIVASDIAGVTELLSGTAAAMLVDPDDLEGATAALQELCSDEALRREMGAAAHQLVQARRSIDLEVARTESMYLELLWTRPRA